MKRACGFFFCLMMVSSLTMADSVDKKFNIEVHGHILKFEGDISPESVAEIEKNLSKGLRTIEINSPGGDINSSLTLAKYIAGNKVDLVVDQYCLSTCANYLFLAAKEKTLKEGAVLGFNGGLIGLPTTLFDPSNASKSQESKQHNPTNNRVLDAIMDAAKKYIKDIYPTDVDFYKSISFNTEFLKIAAEKTLKNEKINNGFSFNCPEIKESEAGDPACYFYLNSGNTFFFPSKATLEKYGVTDIKNYPYPNNEFELSAQAGKIKATQGDSFIGNFNLH